jgi:hypothetical protein
MPFPGTVNYNLAPAKLGDMASTNPRQSALAGQGGFIAGPGGVLIGAFCWQTVTVPPNTTPSGMAQSKTTVINSGSGAPTGFVAGPDGTNYTYLSEATFLIPAGDLVQVFVGGDFWATSSTATTIGQKVFASNQTGVIQTAAAGSIISNYSETQFFVASNNAAGELFFMSTYPAH